MHQTILFDRSLMNDLVQKTMLNVISGIQRVKHHPSEMVSTAIHCLTIVLQHGAVKTFVQGQILVYLFFILETIFYLRHLD